MEKVKTVPVKKKKAAKKKSAPETPSVTGRFDTRLVRFVAGSFFVVLSLFTLVSLISYLFTWAEDQSLLTDDSLISTVISAENSGGKLGFLWSNLLISEWFGLGAFVIPVFFAGVAVFCFRKGRVNLLRLFFLTVMGAIVFSALFSFIFSFTPAESLFGEGAGGSYGYYVNEWLVAMTGNIGAGSIIVLLLAIWLVLMDSRVVDILSRWFDSLFVKKEKRAEPAADTEEENTAVSQQEEQMDSEETESAPVIGDGEEEEDFPELVIEGEEAGMEEEASVSEKTSELVTAEAEAENEEEEEEGEKESEAEAEEEMPVKKKRGLFGFGRKKKKEDRPVPQEEEIEEDQDLSVSDDGEDEEEGDGIAPEEGQEQEGLPPVEILPGEGGDVSSVLSDKEWQNRYDPRLSLCHYKLPDTGLLQDYADQVMEVSRDELEKNNRKIVSTLRNYGIGITKISARIGPTVTLYEIVPAPGVRVSQIKRLEEDIALSLAARGVRVVTLAGTNAIGIEVANERPSIVSMKSLLADPKFNAAKYDLPVAIGRTISNEVMSFDLAKMPHLLVAGATGQGKSVGLNAIIASLLYKKHPAELKFVLVDPKKVELSLYAPIEKHYLAKLPDSEDAIITDTKLVIYTLKSLCILMDHRYDLLKMASVRNIKEYNEKFLSRKLNPHKGHEFMPYIVVIIDEFADLLMTAGREVEEPIARLAQLARAVGIHLVIATQRPTTNIITGTIKANFPARIAFRVISSIDSKTILDQTGANQLIGRGDMLISTGSSEPVRVQCAFIDTPEVDNIAQFISRQPGFGMAYILPEYVPEDGDGARGAGKLSSADRDDLFKEAARLIVREQQGSTSMIQRKMNLGYNRAGRIMDQLEDAGIVGPPEGSKPRHVMITSLESLEDLLSGL